MKAWFALSDANISARDLLTNLVISHCWSSPPLTSAMHRGLRRVDESEFYFTSGLKTLILTSTGGTSGQPAQMPADTCKMPYNTSSTSGRPLPPVLAQHWRPAPRGSNGESAASKYIEAASFVSILGERGGRNWGGGGGTGQRDQ